MPSEKAPVKLTGGGGFGFADRVAALFMAQMLIGGFPLGVRHGRIAKIHLEVRDRGWLLDDLLLELSGSNGTIQCALSLKSNAQITQSGFPESFTTAIWEQARRTTPSVFNRDRDLLCLGIGRIADGVRAAWALLLKQAVETEPERLVERMKDEGQSSEIHRALFSSLQCPHSVCPDGATELETAQIIPALRVLVWDFEDEPSEDEGKAVEICRSALTHGETERAFSLWTELQRIAADGRATGASYDLRGLLIKLRGHYDFKNHPDYQPDWRRLTEYSAESRSGIKRYIGLGAQIPRESVLEELNEKLNAASVVALIGEPGSGKSSLAASVTEQDPTVAVIWLDYTQFDYTTHAALARALHLQFSLPQLIDNSGTARGFLVLDSIEKFSAQARRLAAELVKLISAIPGELWRVLITCQTHMWEYSLREFIDAGIQPKQIATVEITPPRTYEVIQAISSSARRVVPLFTRPELQRVLCNLKVLDWLVTEDTLRATDEAYSFVGETDVVSWIWNRWIGNGPAKHAKAAALIKLAEHDGNLSLSALNILELSHDERLTFGELERDDLIRVIHNRISFRHDLLGDWARLQSLLASAPDGLTRIIQVAPLPRWQRAIRLYAQYILEHDEGTQRWKASLAAFQSKEANDLLAADAFLDALIFAGNAEALFEQVWPDLILENGHLLRRFLKRFLSIATIPDPRAATVADAEDLDWLSVRLRIPCVWFWYAPLRVLDRHHADVARLAWLSAAELCELWLRIIPAELGGRPEAARLAIRLAREVQGLRAEEVFFQEHIDQRVYETLCYAAPDFPDEVSQILLELCCRRDDSPEVKARGEAYIQRRRAERAAQLKAMTPEERKRRHSLPTPIAGIGNSNQRREPAPDGPRARVDESFRLAILSSGALLPVINSLPAVACEVLLAVCIDEPKSEEYADILGNEFGMNNWPGGYPPMYFRGPFLQFLQAKPDEGIEAIARLVGYATTRWQERYLRNAPPDLDPDIYSLELLLPSGAVRWIGNFQVFGWYRDINVGSNAVVSALMALEKWLYDEIGQGHDIGPWVEKILARSTSVAFAGVLTAVGMLSPTLFTGPLQPLIGSWVLLDWQQHLAPQDDVWRIGMMSWTGGASGSITKSFSGTRCLIGRYCSETSPFGSFCLIELQESFSMNGANCGLVNSTIRTGAWSSSRHDLIPKTIPLPLWAMVEPRLIFSGQRRSGKRPRAVPKARRMP